jgi:hypothetical protein
MTYTLPHIPEFQYKETWENLSNSLPFLLLYLCRILYCFNLILIIFYLYSFFTIIHPYNFYVLFILN